MRVKEVIKTVDSDLAEFAKKEISGWSKRSSVRFKEISDLLDTGISKIESIVKQQRPHPEFWGEFEDTIQQLSNWIDSLQSVGEDENPDAFWHEWRSHFDKTLTKIPNSVHLSLTEKSLEPKPGDSIKVRFLKRTSEASIRLQEDIDVRDFSA